MGNNFAYVALDDSHATAGEMVTGNVHMRLKSALQCETLSIIVRGLEEVSWSEKAQKQQVVDGKSKTIKYEEV